MIDNRGETGLRRISGKAAFSNRSSKLVGNTCISLSNRFACDYGNAKNAAMHPTI